MKQVVQRTQTAKTPPTCSAVAVATGSPEGGPRNDVASSSPESVGGGGKGISSEVDERVEVVEEEAAPPPMKSTARVLKAEAGMV
jgi:hypothetical protein